MIKSLIVNYYSFHIFFATPVHWQGLRCLQRIHCLLKNLLTPFCNFCLLTELTDFCNGSLYIFCNIFSLIEVCKRFIACFKKNSLHSFLWFLFADICWQGRAQGSLQWELDWQTWRQLCPLFHFSRVKTKNKYFYQLFNSWIEIICVH